MMTTTHEDEQLLNQVCSGDLAALGALYDKYHMLVFHAALAITRDRRAAEDVLRECFLRLHEQAERLVGEESLVPWLYRSTIELSRTKLIRPDDGWKALDKVLDRLDRLFPPDQALAMRDRQESIQRAIETLPYNQRVVLILYYLGGLRLKEIAHVIDCPLGTVKSRLYYGREILRRYLIAGAEPAELAPAHELAHHPA